MCLTFVPVVENAAFWPRGDLLFQPIRELLVADGDVTLPDGKSLIPDSTPSFSLTIR